MSVKRLFHGKYQSFYLGEPNAGGTVTFKKAGTSSDKDTYSDFALTVANTNPVVLDSQGRAHIYLGTGSYDVTVKASDGTTILTLSNVVNADVGDVISVNKAVNASFEESEDGSNPTDWTLSAYTAGAVTRESTDNAHGLYALKFVSVGAGGGTAISDFIPVTPYRFYDLSFLYKSTVADVRNDMDVLFYDSAKAALSGSASSTSIYSNATSNTTTWAPSSGRFTPPTDARWSKIRFAGCHNADNTPGTTWLDNVKMIEIGGITGGATDGQMIVADSAAGGFSWVNTTKIVTKTTSASLSSTAINPSGEIVVIVDASFTTTASNSDITITIPAPSGYTGKSITILPKNCTGNKVILNRSGAVTATTTASASPEEWWTGCDNNHFVTVASNGTLEYILREHAPHYARVYLNTDESVAAGAQEQMISWTLVLDVGGIWDGTGNEVDVPFDAWATIHYIATSNEEIMPFARINSTSLLDITVGLNNTPGFGHNMFSAKVPVSSGDTIELWGHNRQQDAASTMYGDANGNESFAYITLERRR